LENGYVWIGTANQNPIANPITAYWDAALTVTAAQPVRTLNGYPANAGTPARLYVSSNYSIQVQNKNGSVVYGASSDDSLPTYTTNGIAYAVSATELTTGGSLTFDGTNFATTGQVQATSYNGGQLAGMRNKIINGKMDIAQRGTSFAAPASDSYSLDRWGYAVVGTTGVVTLSQSTDNPVDEYGYSLRATVTTADAAVAAGDVAAIYQKIEGFNVRDLIGKTFALSFWVRSTKTGTHCVFFSNSANNRSYVSEYTVNAANTWEKKTVSVSGGLITAGTWDWTTGVGLQVGFTLIAGSTYQNTAGAWHTGNFLATSAQVNCLDSDTNIFAITGVQLEVGSVATPFEHRPYGAELALCQRYFYAYTCGTSGFGDFGIGYLRSTTSFVTSIKMPVPLRIAPTAITFSGVVGDYAYQAGGTTCVVNGIAAVAFGTDSCSVEFTSATASTLGFGGRVYGSAGARTLFFSGSEL
jgi:hypothetical protein